MPKPSKETTAKVRWVRREKNSIAYLFQSSTGLAVLAEHRNFLVPIWFHRHCPGSLCVLLTRLLPTELGKFSLHAPNWGKRITARAEISFSVLAACFGSSCFQLPDTADLQSRARLFSSLRFGLGNPADRRQFSNDEPPGFMSPFAGSVSAPLRLHRPSLIHRQHDHFCPAHGIPIATIVASGLALVLLNVTINLAHDSLSAPDARINQLVGARASLWRPETIVCRLRVKARQNRYRDSDDALSTFVHLGDTGERNLAQNGLREVERGV